MPRQIQHSHQTPCLHYCPLRMHSHLAFTWSIRLTTSILQLVDIAKQSVKISRAQIGTGQEAYDLRICVRDIDSSDPGTSRLAVPSHGMLG